VRKYVFSLFLLLTASGVFGQKKSVVNLISSSSSTGIKRNGKDVIKVYRGMFKQDYSTLTSDSAYFYPQDNAFDAFGHVVINQGDTLNIYSDKLNYQGNTHTAILTDNVRMVDKDATLTTNHLTYNTATRIGVYTDGGKLVNKDNTLLSKNGYYFAYSRDSYFRYNVSLTTPDALVKTDTMRYNTGTKISYFYGPTNIYGTKGEKKDRDTLYTENGTYNTTTEQANFGKNNLYHSGTKSLKGDSLFYDKLKGFGRASGHVVSIDREQQITLRGNLGTYFKADERTLMTEDPYVIMVTEQDTTKTDSARAADSVRNKSSASAHTITMNDVIKKTIPAQGDTLHAPRHAMALKTDSVKNKPLQSTSVKTAGSSSTPTLKADSVKNKPLPNNSALMVNSSSKTYSPKPPGKNTAVVKATAVKDTSHIKRDSIYMSSDTIETQILTYKDYKIYREKMRLAHIRDTTSKPKAKPQVKEKPSKLLTATHTGIPRDTSYWHRDLFGKPKPVVVKRKPVKPPTRQQLARDSLRKKFEADSIAEARKNEPSDTARIRIMIAHHHAKLFKSDLQAKADSMFYSSSDSTIRCYVKPMIWTQGSQLSGDTIHLQMKHKKLDNMLMFPNAFIVNIEDKDSTHFNQVGGTRMKGYFRDDKLSRMDIDGNAESIYFSRDSAKKTVDGMERSVSSRIWVNFKDNKATRLALYVKPETKYGPLTKFKEDDKILKGFIWKPKDRPVSKESVIPSYNKKKAAEEKSAAAKSKTGKPPLKVAPGAKEKTGKDSTVNKTPGKLPPLKTGKDSTLKRDSTLKPQPRKPTKKDSLTANLI
jgi:lipopolysaccharide export system protein LptA